MLGCPFQLHKDFNHLTGDSTPKRLPHRLALAALIATSSPSWAQESAAEEPTQAARPASVRLGFERLSLPNGEGLGLVGTSYLLQLSPNFRLGPAAYGAITGERGGLFTVGAEFAWQQTLSPRWSVLAGVYAGGGGGGAAPVGGGLMLRPHVDLLAGFGRYRAGVSWSQVRFPSGDISSSQFGLVLVADTGFATLPAAASSSRTTADGVGFDRVVGVEGIYRPSRNSTRVSGGAMEKTVGYVGARFEREFSPGVFAGLEANGAASGGAGGYAEYLATVAAETAPMGPIKLGARLALGMGGGGDVSVGGGLLGKAAAYGSVGLTPSIRLGIEGGMARAPNGRFKAPFAAANVIWQIDGVARSAANARGESLTPAVRTEWLAGVETYRAARRDGSVRTLDNVVLKANRFIADSVYVTGQVHSAYAGGAGGYTVGLIGAGLQSPWWAGWRAGGEFVAGAGGGGGVDSQGGALLQPSVYLDRALGPSSAARLSVGRIESFKGRLSSTVAELSLVYSFGVTAAR